MINRKIFISSTVYDLKNERQAIKEFLEKTSTEHVRFSAVMSDYPETFSLQADDFAENHSYKTCLDKISLCSYYVLIINRRYNLRKEFKEDISITHQEYREAHNQHIPCLVFINSETMEARHQYKKTGVQNIVPKNQIAVFDFIDEVTSQVRANWIITYNNTDDLITKFASVILNFDDSVFISEYPMDGQIMEFYQTFEHTWVIKNNGNVVWMDRYLKCENNDAVHIKAIRDKVEIPITYPGNNVHLTASFKASGLEGVYESYWKMVDSDDNYCFPNKCGVSVCAKVVKSKKRSI